MYCFMSVIGRKSDPNRLVFICKNYEYHCWLLIKQVTIHIQYIHVYNIVLVLMVYLYIIFLARCYVVAKVYRVLYM